METPSGKPAADKRARIAANTSASTTSIRGGGKNPSDNEEIIQRLNNMQAQLNANSAKFRNYTINDYVGRDVPYYAVVKYTPGHPFERPPAVQDVQFATEYLVNTPPPDNLLSLNHRQLKRLGHGMDDDDGLVVKRERMRAIYWFYNDPTLALAADADRNACFLFVDALYDFLKFV